MRSAALLCLFLAVSASALSLRSVDTTSKLEKINKSLLGSTILSTIQLQLSAGSPTDKILAVLNDIKTQLEGDQQAADSKNRTDQADCDVQIADFEHRISEAQANQREADAELSVRRPELKATIEAIETKNKEIADNVQTRENNARKRSEEHSAFEQRVSEHNAALDAIRLARPKVELLANKEAASSFIQVKGVQVSLKSVSSKIRAAKVDSVYTPLIAALAQLAETSAQNFSDQSIVRKILDLLQKLEDALRASLSEENAAETKAQADYEALKLALENDHATLVARRTELLQDQNHIEAVIKSNEEKLARNQEEEKVASGLLAAKEASCEFLSEKYLDESAKRTEELHVVAEVTGIFVNFQSKLRDYMNQRLDNSMASA